MSMMGGIKYYMSHFKFGTIVKLALFFGVIAFVVWGLSFLVLVTAFLNKETDKRLYYGGFFSAVIFYPIIIIAIFVLLKYKERG